MDRFHVLLGLAPAEAVAEHHGVKTETEPICILMTRFESCGWEGGVDIEDLIVEIERQVVDTLVDCARMITKTAELDWSHQILDAVRICQEATVGHGMLWSVQEVEA